MRQKMQLWVTFLVAGRETITYAPPPLRDVLIGRDESVNDIILHDPKVSRMHARIVARPNGFTVQDLESTTGTAVNGAPVPGRKLLMSGDLLTIGSTTLRVVIKPWVRRDEDEVEATINGVPGLGLDDEPAGDADQGAEAGTPASHSEGEER